MTLRNNLGVQWHEGVSLQNELAIADSNMGLVKGIGALGALNNLYERDNLSGKKRIYIAREFGAGFGTDFTTLINQANWQPSVAVDIWLNEMLQPHKYGQVQHFAYLEGPNEPVAPEIDERPVYWKAYGIFEALRVKALANLGIKSIAFNFAVGTPELHEWAYMEPALKEINFLGPNWSLAGIHEYGGLFMGNSFGPNQRGIRPTWPISPTHPNGGWAFGRFLKVLQMPLFKQYSKVMFCTTELGIDDVLMDVVFPYLPEGSPGFIKSWQQASPVWGPMFNKYNPAEFYLEQLKWAAEVMHLSGRSVGGVIFALEGKREWTEFNIDGEVFNGVCAFTGFEEDDQPEIIPEINFPEEHLPLMHALLNANYNPVGTNMMCCNACKRIFSGNLARKVYGHKEDCPILKAEKVIGLR
jgi:hypothetical protein